MRYLLVGIAARLGWAPCSCFDAVNEGAKAHHQTMQELAEARAQIADLTDRLNTDAAADYRLDEQLSEAEERLCDLQAENDQLRELLAKARRVPAPRQETTP